MKRRLLRDTSTLYAVVQYWETFLRVNYIYVHAHVHVAPREQHSFVRVVNIINIIIQLDAAGCPAEVNDCAIKNVHSPPPSHTCVCVCMYMCVCVCVCVCIYIYIYIYIYIKHTVTLFYLVCPDVLSLVGRTSFGRRVWFTESHIQGC